MCNKDSENNNCSDKQCIFRCNNCGTLDCEWNITDFNKNNSLKPESVKIKGFSGDRSIKVTWIQPLTKFPIDILDRLNMNDFSSSIDVMVLFFLCVSV